MPRQGRAAAAVTSAARAAAHSGTTVASHGAAWHTQSIADRSHSSVQPARPLYAAGRGSGLGEQGQGSVPALSALTHCYNDGLQVRPYADGCPAHHLRPPPLPLPAALPLSAWRGTCLISWRFRMPLQSRSSCGQRPP